MYLGFEISKKVTPAYHAMCAPLCRELGFSQTAFDILMFLGNNPNYKTLGEIVSKRRVEEALVGPNVRWLVENGYLTQRPGEQDGGTTELLCTPKGLKVVARGQELQRTFLDKLFANMDRDTRRVVVAAMRMMDRNLDILLESQKLG